MLIMSLVLFCVSGLFFSIKAVNACCYYAHRLSRAINLVIPIWVIVGMLLLFYIGNVHCVFSLIANVGSYLCMTNFGRYYIDTETNDKDRLINNTSSIEY